MMIKASIDSIESMGLVDGPGIRVVVFFNGCLLRCKYCHNPEMWKRGKDNFTPEELMEKIIRYKPYFKANGGVTFSGGEPLLHVDFLIEICKLLKKENIHIALDTAGVGIGKYEELLKYIDLIILDIKHVEEKGYKALTGHGMNEYYKFIDVLNNQDKKVWIRQVVVPNIHDTKIYMHKLKEHLKLIKNIEKIEFLPYHKLGGEKYLALGIENPYEYMPEMDKEKCKELYDYFKSI